MSLMGESKFIVGLCLKSLGAMRDALVGVGVFPADEST